MTNHFGMQLHLYQLDYDANCKDPVEIESKLMYSCCT